MTSQQYDNKVYRYRLERVSKGYIRVTINSDNMQEILQEWKQIHSGLEEMGEKVERVSLDNGE